MFDARGTLWLVAFAALTGLPACVSVSKKVPRDTKTQAGNPAPIVETKPNLPPSSSFAELTPPKLRPGERIPKIPDTATTESPSETKTVARSVDALSPPPAPPSAILPTFHSSPHTLPTVQPVTIDPPLVAAMRAFLENDPSRAVDALKYLDKPNQEFVLATLPALVRGAQMNMAKADPQEVAVLADQLHAAADRLEPQAALRVDKLTFCRKVTGFGRYDPWPREQPFEPNDLAELYLEIRHLRCEPSSTPGEGYVTRLVSSLEVRDSAGRLVDQTDPADWRRRVPVSRFERTDTSRSPVRDYFLKYRFPVPNVPGTYTVTVEVRDSASSRTARSQPLEFRVGP